MSFKRNFSVSLLWVGIGKYTNMLMQLVITAVLARILTPDDYGLIAIATVFMAFFTMLSEVGVGPAIIHNQHLDENDYESLHSFTMYLGLGLAVIFLAISPFISHFYKDDRLNFIFILMSLPIVFSCIQIVPLNLLYKEKNFKYVAKISIITNFISGVVAITYAYFIGGPISLIILQIVNSILLALFYKHGKKVTLRLNFKFESVKKIFSFTFYQFSFNLLNYFSRNLDNLLIGKFLGFSALGYYEKSYKLMLMPIRTITNVLTPVVLPFFAGFQNEKKIVFDKYKRLLGFVSLLSFPISVLFYFCGKEIILILFGNQWVGSILTFKILSLSLGFQVLASTTGAIFQSIGRTKEMFVSQVINTIQMIVLFCMAIFMFKSIEALAVAFCIEELISFLIVFYYLFRLLDTRLVSIFKIILPAVLISLIISFIFFSIGLFFETNHLWASLAIKCIIAFLTIAAAMDFFGYVNYKEIINRYKKHL